MVAIRVRFFFFGQLKKKFFFKRKKILRNFFVNFVYARPYVNWIARHRKQQIAVDGHNGQNTKCYLKRKSKKLRPKLIKDV
jgi:hypothetical protein